ncbi:50S ribosomal protein HLP, mitochondrial-like protein [Tanacetum coccineum]
MTSNLKVVDNSGEKRVMCIQALKGKKGARLGDPIVASVKKAQPGGKVKKGQVVYGVVVRAAMQKGQCDGSEVKFDDNAVVLVNKQGLSWPTVTSSSLMHNLRYLLPGVVKWPSQVKILSVSHAHLHWHPFGNAGREIYCNLLNELWLGEVVLQQHLGDPDYKQGFSSRVFYLVDNQAGISIFMTHGPNILQSFV